MKDCISRHSVAAWLSSHHGVITRDKALQLGLSRAQIVHLVRSNEWERLYRGVYRLSASPAGGLDVVYAAVLAAGEGAVASHLSAAWLWDVYRNRPSRLTVTVPHDRRPRPVGVRTVRSRHALHPVNRHGIPVTSVARTLIDSAAELPADELDDLIDSAIAQKVTSVAALTKAAYQRELRQYPGRRLLARRPPVPGPGLL